MKRRLLYIGLLAALMVAYFVACGGDDTSVKPLAVPEIESADDLDSCGKSNEGDTMYVAEEKAYYLCHKNEWGKIDIPDSVDAKIEKEKKSSSSSKKSEKSGKSSSSAKSSASKDSKSSSSGKSSSSVKSGDSKETSSSAKSSSSKADSSSSAKSSSSDKSSSSVKSSSSKGIPCEEDMPETCFNDTKGIGVIKKCVKGEQVEVSCNTVSCNAEGTACGECVSNESTCTNNKQHIGTVTKCVDGKKVTSSCENVSCDGNECGICLNYEKTCTTALNGEGRITQCVNGRPGGTVVNGNCENGNSCKRTKVGEGDVEEYGVKNWPQMKFVTCGECQNGDTKCENDASGNAVMFYCYEGVWDTVNRSDGYSGHKYDENGFWIVHPCPGDEEFLCADSDTLIKLSPEYNHIGGNQRFSATVTGYRVGSGNENGETFSISTGRSDGGTVRGSCDADGKKVGVCHDSFRVCINRVFGKHGFIMSCEGGRLTDFDGDKDNIACHCEASHGNNGGCSSSNACYSGHNITTGIEMCQPPKSYSGDSSSTGD